jgi:hypothetical protein
MRRIFDNPNQIRQDIIKWRIQPFDNDVIIDTYISDGHHYVGIDTILTETQINSGLALPITTAELAAIERGIQASKTARAIPSWALWTQNEADAWATTNIATPLANARTSLPATLTLATARAAFVVLLNILDKMWILQKANAQMTLAIRDHVWPDLPERTTIK